MTPYILNRLAEPSTWRGLISLATALGVTISPEQAEYIIAACLAIVGAINVFKKDASSPDAELHPDIQLDQIVDAQSQRR